MTSLDAGNIFANITAPGGGESEEIKELLARPGLRIERIVSHGQVSPPGFWFDQMQDEWVIVLAGGSKLRFEDEAEARLLAAGDYVFIPARRRHRIDWTSQMDPTVSYRRNHLIATRSSNRLRSTKPHRDGALCFCHCH